MTIDLKQGTPEWLEFRKSRIGCSDIPVILGLIASKSPLDLYLEKIGEKEVTQNAAMKHGIETEPKAREYLSRLTGITYKPQVAVHPEHDWLMASLDGVDYAGERGCEIKCPYHRLSYEKRLHKGGPIESDFAQMQGQMWVKGWQNILYCCYWSDDEQFISECRRDDEYIDSIKQPVLDFWECIKTKTPPKDKYMYFDDDEAREKENRAIRLKEEIEQKKKEYEDIKLWLMEKSDFNSCKIGRMRLEAYEAKGTVNYKNIPELEGVDLDQYRRPAMMRYSLYIDKE